MVNSRERAKTVKGQNVMVLKVVSQDKSTKDVSVLCDLVAENVLSFRDEMKRLTAVRGKTIRLDFTGVKRIGSPALGVLAATARRLEKNGIRLTARNLSRSVRNVFESSKLDRILWMDRQ